VIPRSRFREETGIVAKGTQKRLFFDFFGKKERFFGQKEAIFEGFCLLNRKHAGILSYSLKTTYMYFRVENR